MKKVILNISLFVAGVLSFTSCGLDNMDEPESMLIGNVQYKGQNLNLQGTGEAIQLQLYQDNYQLHSPITVYVDQQGRFSAKLFNGTYKLVTKDGNGPWVNKRDTTVVNLSGTAEVNLEVMPYFIVSDAKANLSGNSISVTFKLSKIVETATIDKGIISVGSTGLIDGQNAFHAKNIKADAIKVGTNTFTLDLTSEQLSALKSKPRMTVRIGVKASQADQAIYSPVMDLK